MGDDDEALEHIQLKRSTRDETHVADVLGAWLSDRLEAAGPVTVAGVSLPEGTGVANETLMFEASWIGENGPTRQGFVARIASERPLYLDADISIHHDMYAELADVDAVPVPAVYGFEADPTLLGAPFFVMERIEGRVPGDQPPWPTEGFVVDASPSERRQMWDNAVDVLAALHSVPEERFAFLDRGDGLSGLASELDYWRRTLQVSSGDRPHEGLLEGHEWLVANRPGDAATGLSWGDSRFANVMFRGTEVVSIFDWDTVSLAGPEADLGWWRFMDGPAAELPGIGTGDELVDRWQERTGRTARHLEYFDVFTSFRLGVILLRLFGQMAADGTVPPEVAEEQGRNSHGAQVLAEQLRSMR